jgi:DNA repair protein SbcD/Mre11
MLGRPFRFLHASDFHLDQPLHGLTEVPDHLTELLSDAPYQAATRVFDLALAEGVDFVLLLGGLVDPHRAGPRGLRFLSEQFARLAESEITVYWATSPSDGRERWPVNLHWPANVHLLAVDQIERVIHARRGETVCQILGCGSDVQSSFILQALRDRLAASGYSDLFSIAAIPHKLDPSALADLPVRYWAFGGEPNAATLVELVDPQRTARLSGSPQGRSPEQSGPHGCTIVHVDEVGGVRVESPSIDVIRWHEERFEVPATMARSDLDHLFHERTKQIVAGAPDRTMLIRWTLHGDGALLATARRTGLAAELTSHLRMEHGYRTPAAWTVSINVEPPALPTAWYDEETLLGDFLRSIRSRDHSDLPLDIQAYLRDQQLAGSLTSRGTIVEPSLRHTILRQAAWLGADLLHADEAGAKESAR